MGSNHGNPGANHRHRSQSRRRTDAGDGQGGGSVLETLLNLILSEKAGINLQKNTGSSKPMEDFIRQFTASRSAGNGDPLKRATSAAAEKSR
jgi:hypothetical protein